LPEIFYVGTLGDDSMDVKPDPKKPFGCFAVLILVILAISFFTTGSLNPLTIYESGILWAKIVATILVLLSLPVILQILFALRAAIGWIIIFAIFSLAFFVISDEPSQDGKVKAAYTLLDQMKTLNPENESIWGISNFEILADVRRFRINPPQVKDNQVIIPVWIKGTNNQGVSGKWKMKLLVTVKPTPATGLLPVFETQDFSVYEIEPLSWWEQLGRWLVWSFMVPIAILFLVYFWDIPILQFAIGIFSFVIGILWLVGYLAFAFFGSIWAVVFGVLFGIVVAVFFIGIASS
jgi:hypothetical protein